MKIGVVLAAGASSRMGASKPLERLKGESFLARGIRNLWSACDKVVVVLGAEAARVRRSVEEEFQRLVNSGGLHAELQAAHRHGAAGLEVHFVLNRSWAKGMYDSARAGLAQALHAKADSVVVLPVDHPYLAAATVRTLGAAMDAALSAYKGSRRDRAQFAYAVVPRHEGRRGHPVVLSPGLARRIAADAAADDLSDAIRRNARLVGYLDVPDPGVVRNVNTPDELEGAVVRRRRAAARPKRRPKAAGATAAGAKRRAARPVKRAGSAPRTTARRRAPRSPAR